MQQRTLKEKILLTVSATTALSVFPFLIFSIIAKDNAQILVDTMAILLTTAVFIGVWITNNTQLFSKILAAFAQLIVGAVIYIKGASVIYWLYPVIISSFYLIPPIIAGLFSFTLICVACLFTFEQYDSFTFSRVFITLILTVILAFAFSIFIQKQNQKLTENEKFNRLRNKILELIASSAKLSEVLMAIAHSVENEYPSAMCSVLLLDKTGQKLTLGAAPSLPDFYNNAVEGTVIGQGIGSCGTAAYTGKRVIVSDINTHPYWAPWVELTKKANLAACWSEPIINNQGKVLGTFAIYHTKVTSPTTDDFTLIEQFANLSRIAIEREQADQLIWRQANFDNLTQLPNRSLIHEHLIRAIHNAKREKTQLALAMLDLDNFKDVNDSLGHSAGDALLIETAKRINNNIRENDIVARLGGDEFVILMINTKGTESIDLVGQKLLSALAKPYQLEQESVHCTASIGVAIYPNDATDMGALMRNADQAMYGAKSKGRNSIHYFTESMRTDFLQRIQLIQDLRTAIEQQQFYIVYQPIINLQTNKICKAEALIRWQHPEKGLISPLDFIPLAEETGLIVEISEWIFQEVSQQVKLWRSNNYQELQISINTSPVQYKNKGQQMLSWVAQLKEENISPQAINIEITENLLMENQEEIEDTLANIREQGIAVSIDDFGTGYCSFSYLKNFSIDYLKIDKSFVQNMSSDNNDMALCEAIIVMANKLNINVIAEGIETEQQRQLLADAGCTLGQGYLLAKPLIKDDFEQLLIKGII